MTNDVDADVAAVVAAEVVGAVDAVEAVDDERLYLMLD